MKIMVITSSPNTEGLTAACAASAVEGIAAAGAEVLLVNLNRLDIASCHACGSGWGPCLEKHNCQLEDDFQKLHSSLQEVAGYVFVTPVYWGDMSESARVFFDRVRRCEAWKKEPTYIQDKPFLAVAAAGGSGNGIASTLTNIERLLMHLRADRFDYIGITKKSRIYKLNAILEASKAMIEYINSK